MPAVTRRRPTFLPATEPQPGQSRRHKPDYWLLVLSALLLAIGLIVVYSISPGLAVEKSVGQTYFINRQLIWAGLGIIGFFVAAQIPLAMWQRLQQPLLVVAVLSAVIVRVFGDEVNGAYRWIQVGGFSFQPVELIKFTLLLWLAGFLVQRLREGTFNDFKQTIRPIVIAVIAIVVLVAGVQSDFGSTAVMVAMMGAMVIVAGMPMKRLGAIAAAVLVLGTMAIVTSDYRQDRLATFLNPEADCLNTGYQACQALIAVGSGGFIGLGLGRSVQAFGYLPEAENDSIFAIYAEKFGFVGVLVFLALLIAFLSRIKRVIERAPDDFSRLVATGIFAWFSIQAVINIGAMIGLLPLKGITLPFISYGGSSILFVMLATGVIFHISRYTLYSVPRSDNLSGGGRHESSDDRRRIRGAYHPNPVSRP
ncbi:MAG TPA: putative lipid II flippase FtsW [Candidatus Saccharimonadales bacterium]|nr:putative lipid II flippase FtsW [Candidatus Saccharimonadales bacterium]